MNIGTLTATMGVNTTGLNAGIVAMQNMQKQVLKSVNDINAKLNTVTANMQKVQTSTKVAGQAITKIEKPAVSALNNVGASILQVSQGLRSFGWLATTVFTAPIIMFGKSIITAGMNFEFTLKKMIGLAGVAKDSIGQISEEVKKISSGIGINPQKVAESYYFVASSGIKKASDVLKITEMAAKGAASGMGEVNDIAKLLTSSMNAYASTGLNVNKMMDVLTATIRVGKAEPAEMVNAFGTILPIAEKLGLTIGDVGGALSTMTLITNSTATSATYLRNVLMKLLDPTPQVRDAMKSMGISMEQIHTLLKTPDGFIKTMELLGKTTEKYGVTMDTLFPEMRSLLGALNFTEEGLKRLKENTNEVNKSSGDFQKHLAEMSTTMQMRWNKAIADSKNAMLDMGATVASALLPILEKLVARLTSIITWFESLSESNQRLILRITAFAAAIGPVCLILATFGNAIGNVWGWVDKLGGATGFGKLNIALRALPFVAVGVGLVKLIGWFSDQHDATLKAQEATASLNDSLIAIGGTMQSLSSLGIADYSAMSLNELSAANVAAYNTAQKAVDEYNKLEKLRKENTGHDKAYDILEDPYIVQFEKAKKTYEETNKFINDYTENTKKATTATQEHVRTLEQLQEAMEKSNQASSAFNAFKSSRNAANATIGADKGFGMALPFDTPRTGGWQLNVEDNNKYLEFNKQLQHDLDIIANKEKVLGASYNSSKAYLNAYSNAYTYLLENFAAGNPVIDEAIAKYMTLAQTMETSFFKEETINRLTDAFTNFFSITKEGFQDFGKYVEDWAWSVLQSFENLLAGMLAKKIMEVLFPTAKIAATTALTTAATGAEIAKGTAIAGTVPATMLASTAMDQLTLSTAALAAAWVPFPGTIAAVAGNLAGVAAALTSSKAIKGATSIVGLAEGGIIPSGYPNDTYPAMLSSGETVLPKALSGAAMQNQMSGEVVFTIAGTTLVGVLKNQGRKSNSFK